MTFYDFSVKPTWPDNPDVPAAEVWTKPSWDANWTRRHDLIPVQSVWSAAPQVSTATLEYRYGEVMIPGGSRKYNLYEITARGYYVLIKWYTDNESPMHWLGIAETPVKAWHEDGDNTALDSGLQQVPCYGLEVALQDAIVNTVVHENADSGASEKWKRSGTATEFNENERGNRTSAKIEITETLDRYLFSNPRSNFKFWTTRDIIEYLMTFHLPTDSYGVSKLPWGIDSTGINLLPTWDRPSVVADGRSVYEILSELMPTSRMLGWYVGGRMAPVAIGAAPIVNEVNVVPFSRAASPIVLTGLGSHPANPDVHIIDTSEDPLTTLNIDEDDSEVVDELIVQGPREVAVCTLAAEYEIAEGWDASQESGYEDGASGDAGWATMQDFEKWEANKTVRGQSWYEDVYSYFVMPVDWDGQASLNEAKENPQDVFFPETDENGDEQTHIPYMRNVSILEELPLFSGVDYAKEISLIDESKGWSYTAPMTMFDRAASIPLNLFTYAEAKDAIPDAFNARHGNRIPVTVTMKPDNEDGPGFRLKVNGAPQHAIAKSFVGNDGDRTSKPSRVFGDISYGAMRVTCALMGDRRPSYIIKNFSNPDTVRRKLITIEHPALAHVRIAPNTAVGLAGDGSFQTCPGGTLRDPEKILRALCTLASKTYLETRKSVRINTGRRIAGIYPGSVIKRANGVDVDSVVSEVRIDAPTSDGHEYSPVMQSFRAATNQVDIVDLMGRTAEIVNRSTPSPKGEELKVYKQKLKHAINNSSASRATKRKFYYKMMRGV